MSLQERIENIVARITMFDTWDARYKKIIEYSKLLPDFPIYLKTEKHLVKGCQSNVWIDVVAIKDKLFISGYSDSVFLRGFLFLLIQIFSGQNKKEVQNTSFDFLQKIGFQNMMSSSRTSGLIAIVNTIKKSHE